VLLAAGFLLLPGACATSTSGLPAGTRAAPPGEVTPTFQGMRTLLLRAQQRRVAGDAAGLRGMDGEITEMGLGLIRSTLPHDVRRADVPRYMEGRAAFGEQLKVWALTVGRGDDEALYAALDGLVGAYWGWVDAYKGLPPERSL
jgi:hypothetical protein